MSARHWSHTGPAARSRNSKVDSPCLEGAVSSRSRVLNKSAGTMRLTFLLDRRPRTRRRSRRGLCRSACRHYPLHKCHTKPSGSDHFPVVARRTNMDRLPNPGCGMIPTAHAYAPPTAHGPGGTAVRTRLRPPATPRFRALPASGWQRVSYHSTSVLLCEAGANSINDWESRSPGCGLRP